MNHNVAIDHPAFLAWDGTNSFPRSITGYVSFGFVFEAVEDIEADTSFYVDAAPASATDPKAPSEIFTVVNKINTCSIPSHTNEPVELTVPAGTKKGEIVAATIPCFPDKFIRLVGITGDPAKVRAVIVCKGKGA